MNNSKICFIYCVNDERKYAESAKSIDSLLVPEGFITDKIAITEAESITSGYNVAMNHSDAKYKVYLHQDTLIINKNFIFDCLALFQTHPNLGLLGMVGATIPINGIWWEARKKFGKVYDSHTGTMELLVFQDVHSDYVQVTGIDGFMMITQYDVPWREDLIKGWHYYDLSQSAEFMKAGYEVGVPKQENPWCIHDCGVVNVRNGFDENRAIFLEEYAAQLFPLVSVMIPTYNRPRYFELALKSALEQTYKHIEIIVCDDSTNDQTQQLIQAYLQTYKNIHYFKNEQNLGPVQNDLKCMELATGEYVNFLMDDDLFHPHKIEKMMNYFLDCADMKISLVTSHRQLIDDHGNSLQDIRSTSKLFNENTLIDGYEFGSFMLRSVPFNYIGEPTTALFRKKDLEEPFGTFLGREYGCNVDMAAWMRLLSKGNIIYIPESLSYFRIHGEQQQHSEKMLVAGMLDYAHQILKAPQLGFFSNEAHYVQAIGNCLNYMSDIVNGISEEYRRSSDFQQIAFFQHQLTQKLQELLNKQPLVSVLIPSYNRPQYLELALQSVLNQTYKNIEIIICDDSTNDEVQQMIQPYLSSSANRIRYYKNQSTLGGVLNFRKCFELSHGEYINYLMDDDLFHINKIEKMMWYFLNDTQKEISLVTSYRQRIDELGNELPEIEETKKLFEGDTIVEGIKFGEFICKDLMNVIGEPTTVLFRKESLKEPFGVFGGRQYKNNVDLASWMSLLSVGNMVYVSDVLSYLRAHTEQVSNTTRASIEGYIDFAHQIVESPNHGYFKEIQEYKAAVDSCLHHLKYAIEANKDNVQDFKDLTQSYLAVEEKWSSLIGKVIKIDLGCGNDKEANYFGLDVYKGSQVDWVMDFNTDRLPFDDNSIEHAVTYHALEHIQNLQHIVSEAWRVLKPNAQFFVCVPYYNSHINLANIFHVQNFNEHSFRFFSSEISTHCLPEHLWKYHFTPTWGLKASANSFTAAEFRCLKIEFDYFPAYKNLSEAEKELARQKHINVVHNICFYLQAIKPGTQINTIHESDIIVPNRRKWMIDNNW